MAKEYEISRFDSNLNFISKGKLLVEQIEAKIILTYSEPSNNIKYTVWDYYHHLKALEKLRLLIEVEHNSLINCSGCRKDYNYRPTGNILGQLHSADPWNPDLIDCYSPTEKTELIIKVASQMESYEEFLAEKREVRSPSKKANWFNRLTSKKTPITEGQRRIEIVRNKLTNLETIIKTVSHSKNLKNLNIHIIQDSEDLRIKEINSAVICVFAVWSGYSHKLSNSILTRINKILKQKTDVIILDLDFTPIDKQKELFGKVTHGYFESAYIQEGRIVSNYTLSNELDLFYEKIEQCEKK
jgi:hypothetical protein